MMRIVFLVIVSARLPLTSAFISICTSVACNRLLRPVVCSLPLVKKMKATTRHSRPDSSHLPSSSLPSTEPDKWVSNFWESLSAWDLQVNGTVTAPSGLIYRTNKLDVERQHLFLRQCYFDMYDKWLRNTNLEHTFITGTPGIGKTMARNAMVAMQMRDAKASKSDMMIVIAKSPQQDSMKEVAVIKGGCIRDSFSVTSLRDIPYQGNIPVMMHADISNGFVNDVGTMRGYSNDKYFYYTSPNKNAWYEKCKEGGVVLIMPSWVEDEVEMMYLGMGCKGVLISRLRDAGCTELPLCDETSMVTLRLRGGADGEESVVDISYDGHQHSILRRDLRAAIRHEMAVYGPVPRYLFMGEVVHTHWLERWKAAVMSVADTIETLGSNAVRGDTRQRLLQTSPKQLEDGTFDFQIAAPSTWLGEVVLSLITERVFQSFEVGVVPDILRLERLNKADAKVMERVYLLLFASDPKSFQVEVRASDSVGSSSAVDAGVGDGTNMLGSTSYIPFTAADIEPFSNSKDVASSTLQLASKKAMQAFASTFAAGTMVTPLFDEYPGIDGLAHTTVKMGNQSKRRVQMFFQQPTALTHRFSDEAVHVLKDLMQRTIKYNQEHPDSSPVEMALMWLVSSDDFKIDKTLSMRLGLDLPQYVVTVGETQDDRCPGDEEESEAGGKEERR